MARRVAGRLTAEMVEGFEKPGLYGDGLGLYVRVSPTGGRSYVFRYSMAGVRHEMGLGPTHIVTLTEARRRARELRRLKFEGIDPLSTRSRRMPR